MSGIPGSRCVQQVVSTLQMTLLQAVLSYFQDLPATFKFSRPPCSASYFVVIKSELQSPSCSARETLLRVILLYVGQNLSLILFDYAKLCPKKNASIYKILYTFIVIKKKMREPMAYFFL